MMKKEFICPKKHNSVIQPPGHVLINLNINKDEIKPVKNLCCLKKEKQ